MRSEPGHERWQAQPRCASPHGNKRRFAFAATALFVVTLAGLIVANVYVSRDYYAGQKETRLAESATAGATRVVVNGKEAMVMFAADSNEAKDLAQQYEGGPGEGKVDRNGNAVVAWTGMPTSEEARSVKECLQ